MENCNQCNQEITGKGNPVYDENYNKIIARICDNCYSIHLGIDEEESNTSKKSNNLNSHYPEKHSHRVDKMSGTISGRGEMTPNGKKVVKKISNKKRRQLFKQNKEDKF